MSASRETYVQRPAAIQANLRVAEVLEFESRPMPTGSVLREEPSRRVSASVTGSNKVRHPWQREYLQRESLPPINPGWEAEMENVEVYKEKSRDLDKHTLDSVPNATWIKYVIYMIMETSQHYNWLKPKRVADRENIEGIGKEVYWRTGVLLSAEEVLRVWRNGRTWVRFTVKKFVQKGWDEEEMERAFEMEPAYPYIRYARILFLDYEKELRKMCAGQQADEALIKQREDEDDIRFEGVYRSDHQMSMANIKSEGRNGGEYEMEVNAENLEIENPLPDSDPTPAPPPPPTEPSRRRSAPSDEPVEASPNKVRATAALPSDQPFRSPIAPVNHPATPHPARQVSEARSGAQEAPEGFVPGISPAGSESPIAEPKPVRFLQHPDVVQPQLQPMDNPLNQGGVYRDFQTHTAALTETCNLLANRLMFFMTNTPYQQQLLDMFNIMADTLEEEGKMEIPEVLNMCMHKHAKIARNRRQTNQ